MCFLVECQALPIPSTYSELFVCQWLDGKLGTLTAVATTTFFWSEIKMNRFWNEMMLKIGLFLVFGCSAAFGAPQREPAKVEILQNYSVFSVFNASKSDAESSGDSLIRYLDSLRRLPPDAGLQEAASLKEIDSSTQSVLDILNKIHIQPTSTTTSTTTTRTTSTTSTSTTTLASASETSSSTSSTTTSTTSMSSSAKSPTVSSSTPEIPSTTSVVYSSTLSTSSNDYLVTVSPASIKYLSESSTTSVTSSSTLSTTASTTTESTLGLETIKTDKIAQDVEEGQSLTESTSNPPASSTTSSLHPRPVTDPEVLEPAGTTSKSNPIQTTEKEIITTESSTEETSKINEAPVSKDMKRNNSELVKSMGKPIVEQQSLVDVRIAIGVALGVLAVVVGVGCLVSLVVCGRAKPVKNPVAHWFERKHVYATMEANPLATTGHFQKPGPPVILPHEQQGGSKPHVNESFQPETSTHQVTVLWRREELKKPPWPLCKR